MLSAKEREIRRHQLGASEIYKIFNFDSQECQDLWELKIGLQDYQDLDNEAIEAGNILEEDCLKYYEETTNRELIYNERIEHPKIKGLVVSMDAREKETSIPVENKVINEKTWDKWKAKRVFNAEFEGQKLNIPKSYYCQIQTQIDVCNTEYGILNVNTLTDEEQADPINVELSDLTNKKIKIFRSDIVIFELENRAKYFLECMRFRKRPSELEYLEERVF